MIVGIIGAGITGLACASRLAEHGIGSRLFDKGKRPGGRLSSLQLDPQSWDFGAQYFRPLQADFAAQVADWEQRGLAARWLSGPEGAVVGVPSMSALVEAQCAAHDTQFEAQVQRIEATEPGWRLAGPSLDDGPFAAVVVAVPAEQAVGLLSLHDLALASEAAAARSRPCWTVLAAFAEPLAGVPDLVRDAGDIAWAARNNSKPGRADTECWVIQAGADWSQRNLERDPADVADELLALLAAATGSHLPPPTFLKAHRWRFGMSYGQRGRPLWNPQLRLGACGDWCLGPQIEGAWRSGGLLADQIAAALIPDASFSRETQALDAS